MGKSNHTTKFILAVFIASVVSGFSGHESPYPTDYFESPLEIPLLLSGSFGELRSNHFHSGIDIKTQDREGHKVAASADGWVSRVYVSPGGYGNALYVDHPNGYTTVYAHLQSFRDDIAQYVEDVQYSKKRFAIDVRPDEGRFTVEKGKEIARSGNSGSSTGPHLHFEIRTSNNSNPLNPQSFGVSVLDTTPPRIFRVKLYPAESGSYIRVADVKGTRTAVFGESLVLAVKGAGSRWALADGGKISAHGAVKFAIQTHDYQEGSRSRLGATTISLTANDDLLFESTIDEFSFSQTRYLNAHIDYEERQKNRRWFHRNHLLPGNRLPFYSGSRDGILRISEGETVAMNYSIHDIRGNESKLAFNIVGIDETLEESSAPSDVALTVPYGQDATLSRSGIRLNIPSGALYESTDLKYERSEAIPGSYAEIHSIHDGNTPVHSRMTVSVLANRLPPELRMKAVVAGVSSKGNIFSLGGEYAGGYVTTRVRSFGKFTIAVDTTGPKITPLNLAGNMSERRSIRVKATDDLSGIQSYNGYIDGEWILMKYDSKKSLFYHTFDDRTEPGPHSFKFVVRDNKGNQSEIERTFAR